MLSRLVSLVAVLTFVMLAITEKTAASAPSGSILKPEVVDRTITTLVEVFGQANASRIERGVRQVAARWWAEDGNETDFTSFCKDNFVKEPEVLKQAADRLEFVFEQLNGHLHEVRRELTSPLDLDTGKVHTTDRLLANLDLSANLTDDLFKTKLAFYFLLNFPLHSLTDRLAMGGSWDRTAWARSRMMDSFTDRVPAEVNQNVTQATTAASNYIDGYNIRMDRLVTSTGQRLFPEGLRLVSHWGIRDELASHYAEADGIVKQRLILMVMERIVRQEIPAIVIDNPEVEWCPETNEVRPIPGAKLDAKVNLTERERDRRYAKLLDNFKAYLGLDPYFPTAPTAMARAFEQRRQIPEREVEALLDSILASKEVKDLGVKIATRLGRKLEPFDIWYSGFRSRGSHTEEELDRIVRNKYPNKGAFQKDLPNILTGLGFSSEKAAWLAAHIVVDPSRGPGHATPAIRREDKAHLRTRVGVNGMDYKGYNIAVHEFGHNVEQVFSLHGIDHYFLSGVPANAFTEAFAYEFQDRDLELLGLHQDAAVARQTRILGTLWMTYEIGGVSLVDMKVWNWMYAHPKATPAELREATLAIAREIWNRYFTPVFGQKDCEILAIYSHMIAYPLYLPDYAIGHIIDFQIGEKLEGKGFGAEFERMARQGRLTPDAWMRDAVGGPISAQALLKAARAVIDATPK